MKRLTTRSIATATAIRDREDFITSGALRGNHVTPGTHHGTGDLNGNEAMSFNLDEKIDYVVWSYSTPIAWHRTDGTWHIVNQKFSLTTTKHQGNLYMVKNTAE